MDGGVDLLEFGWEQDGFLYQKLFNGHSVLNLEHCDFV